MSPRTPVAVPERRMPVRTVVVALDGDYAGFSATMRSNPPIRLVQQLGQGDFAQLLAVLTELITEWNFVDEDGIALPHPRDGGWDACSHDVVNRLVDGYMTAVRGGAEPPKES